MTRSRSPSHRMMGYTCEKCSFGVDCTADAIGRRYSQDGGAGSPELAKGQGYTIEETSNFVDISRGPPREAELVPKPGFWRCPLFRRHLPIPLHMLHSTKVRDFNELTHWHWADAGSPVHAEVASCSRVNVNRVVLALGPQNGCGYYETVSNMTSETNNITTSGVPKSAHGSTKFPTTTTATNWRCDPTRLNPPDLNPFCTKCALGYVPSLNGNCITCQDPAAGAGVLVLTALTGLLIVSGFVVASLISTMSAKKKLNRALNFNRKRCVQVRI